MASKKKRRALVFLEAQRILWDSLKVPLSSDNLAGGVDNSSSGIVPVLLMPEDKKWGAVLLDKEDQLVREPDVFPGSRDVDVDAGELMVVDPVDNLRPGFPVAKLSTGGELKVVLASADPRSFLSVEASNSLPDVGIDGAPSEQ